jgi:putative protease
MPAKKRKVIKRKKIVKKVVKKKISKKAVRKVVKKIKKPIKKQVKKAVKKEANLVGKVTHYFPHVQAAVIKLKAPLKVGDSVKIKGHTTDFVQNVVSMQMDREPIVSAKPGQEIGLLVKSRVRQHDVVTKV